MMNISSQGYYNTLAKLGMPVGSQKSIAVNLAVTDAVINQDIRLLSATTGSVLFVDLTTPQGVDSNVPIPPNMPIVNVTKIYIAGTDCTNIRAWPVD